MKVTFTSQVTADNVTYLVGESYTLPDYLATSFIGSGWAKVYVKPEPVKLVRKEKK